MFIFVKSRIEDFNVFLPHFCKLSNLTCVFIRYIHIPSYLYNIIAYFW